MTLPNSAISTSVTGRRRLLNVLTLFLVVLLFALFLEGVLRLAYPLYSNFNTEMWRYSTEIKTLSSWPNVSHEHLPHRRSTLYGVEIATNALGFRDSEILLKKPDDAVRILLLGDSVTLGWGVDASQTYSEVLERKLNRGFNAGPGNALKGTPGGNSGGDHGLRRYEVINTAVGNYNSPMEAEIAEKYLFLGVDAIVVGFFPNDAEDTVMVEPGAGYWLKKTFYIYPFFWDRLTKLKFALSGEKYTSRIHQFYTAEYRGREKVSEAFRKLGELSRKHDLPVYVAIIPQFYSEFEQYDSQYIHDFVLELCAREGFACIDTLEKFKKYPLSEIVISAEDAHPNPLGHQIIAGEIYAVMAEEFAGEKPGDG